MAAAKRLHDGSDQHSDDPDKPEQKRLRALPSFSTIIREALMLKSLQNFVGSFEPMLRRVVREELERVLHSTHFFQRSPQMQIEELESSNFRLVFQKPPSLPIFTGSRIEDSENNALQILLIDTQNAQNSLATFPSPIKLHVVVLDGHFPHECDDNWTSAEFDKYIVKERIGKRPLLTGEFPIVLREGVASIGELIFTDNSSWIRSQQFRIGVRIVHQSYKGPRIREAITEAFRVKDHRGELNYPAYKKHYPPALTDDVWRLEKIGRDGAYHTRLSSVGINTVHDFLKLLVIDSKQLRRILGVRMSDQTWEVTIGHARTCPVGEKLYTYEKQHYTVFVNSICDVIAVAINGAPYSFQELNRTQKVYVQEMVQEAYQNWDMLKEYDGM